MQEPHAGHERSASPPWGSWHNVSMQHQQEAGDVPDSPRSTGDWELLNAAASSGHGSSARLACLYTSSPGTLLSLPLHPRHTVAEDTLL